MRAWGEAGAAVAGFPAGTTARDPFSRLASRLETERDRFVLWAPVFLGLGIGIYFALPHEPPGALAAAGLLAAVALRLVLQKGTIEVAVTGIALCVALGFACAKARTELLRAPVIDRETGIVAIEGLIELIEPRSKQKGERLTLRVVRIDGMEPAVTPLRVRLVSRLEPAGLGIGASVRLKAVLLPPPPPERPGGHDFARAAWFERIGATGYLVEKPVGTAGGAVLPFGAEISLATERLRAATGERIRRAVGGEAGALAEAMITGERGGISEARMDALRDSGLAHILAISGFNMAIMAGALFGFVRAALALFPRLVLVYPVKVWAAFAGVAGAFFCLVISGAASATTRAFIMIALMLAATALGRPGLSMRNLALAALLILLAAPESLLDVGFQMSFAAVVALMAVYEGHAEGRDVLSRIGIGHGTLSRIARFLAGTLASTAIASLAVAPLATFHFHKLAQYGLLANVVAVPIFTFAIMPLVVVSLALMPFGLEAPPLLAMSLALEAMMGIAHYVAAIEGSIARVPAFPVAALALMMLGGLWLAIWRGAWRLLGLIGLAGGLAVAALDRQPDILVAADGAPVAIRQADGRLAATPVHGESFALKGWLDADADPRTAKEASDAPGFPCDRDGCVGTIAGLTIAVPLQPQALADDCSRAVIVIVAFADAPPCAGPRLVIDRRRLAERGAHAITLSKGAIEIETVAASRGARPWTRPALTHGAEIEDPPAVILAGPSYGGAIQRRRTGPR
jgi:competence protein ComEC